MALTDVGNEWPRACTESRTGFAAAAISLSLNRRRCSRIRSLRRHPDQLRARIRIALARSLTPKLSRQ